MTATTNGRPVLNLPDSPLTVAAVETYRLGRTPLALVPGSKRPARDAWQRLAYRDETDVVREFGAMIVGAGLGVRLGEGLADVDLDSATARRAAPLLLPSTPMRSGRESAPASHWWFRLGDGAERYVKHIGPDSSAVVEVRATTGHQTAIPPTVHPSGELYRWEGEPWQAAEVSTAELLAGAASVALVAVLADAWPGGGSRHDAYLALVGGLLRGCEQAPAMVTA
ncbi:MAG: bifunctional DNA primase/polymerase [Actinomycetota bacterium]|nr:bifunctional DNA primase/polymerase [Actinomycetota bacterium]